MQNKYTWQFTQHIYEIFNIETGEVVKTGISGGKISKNRKSYRATCQVNKWNKDLGETCWKN